ncbi:MAG: DUF4197 domain-containing protein [Candidatus Krumholzibacteriia bacterium]
MRILTFILLVIALAGCAGMENLDLGTVLGGPVPLDEATVASGLKEALTVGTSRAAGQVGALDGYLGNELLRIALPAEVQDVAGTLRTVGLGGKVDELEVAMNRAAEQAAGEAVSVFGDAIRGMTLADAWGILRGPDTAATDYFRDRTGAALTGRYRPIIETKLRSVGGYSDYETLVARLRDIPFVEAPDLDLVGYVTDHALDGLFAVLATEEQKIRADPLARTTALLQRVFGAQ